MAAAFDMQLEIPKTMVEDVLRALTGLLRAVAAEGFSPQSPVGVAARRLAVAVLDDARSRVTATASPPPQPESRI